MARTARKGSTRAKRPGRETALEVGDPTRRPANKGRTYPAEILTPDEVRALVKACSSRAPTGVRNRALLVLLYRGGLRVSEALGLHPKDVDRQAGTVTVLRGKGGKRRTIGLDPGAFAFLERWVDLRAQRGINGRAPIFCTLEARPIASAYVRALLPRLGRKAGIEKRVHAHGLRHSHAFELSMEGVPMPVIQAQLGHASLAVTSRYLAHIAPAELVQAMQKRPAFTL